MSGNRDHKVLKNVFFGKLILLVLVLILPLRSWAEEQPTHILILFDMSHSMTRPMPNNKQGPAKIKLARQAFAEVMAAVPDNVQIAFRIFGHSKTGEKAKDCLASEMSVPFALDNRTQITGYVGSAKPEGHKTPITYALKQAMQDMKGIQGNPKIILISDGEENCEQDPEEAAEQLLDLGVPVDTIGIGSPGSFAQLGMIALAGGGKFSLGENLQSIKKALQSSMPAAKGGKLPESGAGALMMPETAEGGMELVKVIPVPPPSDIEIAVEQTEQEPSGPVMSIEIILDASGSMMKKLDGKYKMDIAKSALNETVSALDSELIRLAFRAYGFDDTVEKTPEASCPNTELLVSFDKGGSKTISDTARGLKAYGYTPIAKSLELAGQDLKQFSDSKPSIVLISDGEETCGGDPVRVIEDLKKAGIDVQVHVIGFDIDEKTRKQLKQIAKAGDGLYFDAENYNMLIQSLQAVIDSIHGKVAELAPGRFLMPVMGGNDIDHSVVLSPGRYTLKDHVQKGHGNYYFVQTDKGELAVIRGYIQSKAVTKTREGELKEAKHHLGGFTIFVFDPDKKEIKGRKVLVRGEIGSQAYTHYMDITGRGFYFAVGDDYARTHKDALFDVGIHGAGDILVGKEAPESPKDGGLLLEKGTEATAHLGLEDAIDTYKIMGPFQQGDKVKLDIRFAVPDFRFRVDVYDESGTKRVARFYKLEEGASLTVDMPGTQNSIYVSIMDNNPGLYNMFSSYAITVSNSKSE